MHASSCVRLLVLLHVAALSVVNSTVLCDPHDDSDIAVAQCEDWCSDVSHCAFCKCRRCSLCQRECTPATPDDVTFESCESW